MAHPLSLIAPKWPKVTVIVTLHGRDQEDREEATWASLEVNLAFSNGTEHIRTAATGELHALKSYLIERMLWDPTADDLAIISEFLDAFYTPRAAPWARLCWLLWQGSNPLPGHCIRPGYRENPHNA